MYTTELVCEALDEGIQPERHLSNQQDSLESLVRSLNQQFREVSVEVVRHVLFSGIPHHKI